MFKASILYLILSIAMLFPFDLAFSVVPGLHATIFPPYFFAQMLVCLWVFILSVVFFILYRRDKVIKSGVLLFHFIATIPLVIFIKFPFTRYQSYSTITTESSTAQVDLTYSIIMTLMVLFFIGQIAFGWSIVKILKSKITMLKDI